MPYFEKKMSEMDKDEGKKMSEKDKGDGEVPGGLKVGDKKENWVIQKMPGMMMWEILANMLVMEEMLVEVKVVMIMSSVLIE